MSEKMKLLIVIVVCLQSVVLIKADVDDMIIGGVPVNISQYPYMVSIRRNGLNHHCGGALVNDRCVVTAAHCFYSFKKTRFTLRTGSSDIIEGGTNYNISRIISHPDFHPLRLTNDIALVMVDGSVLFDDETSPIPLANPNISPIAGDIVTVIGWGYTAEYGDLSDALLEVKVEIFSRSYCSEAYKDIRNITETMFCAGYSEGDRDSCKGDSGGPLIYNERLAGVVSWGRGCGRAGLPGVYSNITYFNKWIVEYMGVLSTF